ncbi:hypothetical protein GALL_484450 [mine drainage metagenome]|uniref:Uncharacterized protein n=1 Tax=mine drainage metagenome TaxID=410659 RepID=A0A1J5PXA4_9ZZZZ
MAPIGCPLAFNPPEGLIGSLPSFRVQPSLMARAPCPLGVNPIASYSMSSATVKQSWVSTKDKSESCTPADCSARCHATVQPSNCRMSRFDIGRKSCAWAVARKLTALPIDFAVSASASTSAAAPSDTSEQSVRLSGPATNGFFSLSERQNS